MPSHTPAPVPPLRWKKRKRVELSGGERSPFFQALLSSSIPHRSSHHHNLLYLTVPHRFPWTPPKTHRFYGKSMDFGWTMISFGEICPCRSVIPHCLLQICFTFSQSHILTNS